MKDEKSLLKFASSGQLKIQDNIAKLLESGEKSSMVLALTTLLSGGVKFCEKYVNYMTSTMSRYKWGNVITVIEQDKELGIVAIPWGDSIINNEERSSADPFYPFPRWSFHILDSTFLREGDWEIWTDNTIIKL